MTDGWYIYMDQIPNLLLALLVLFIGWLVAKGLGKGVAAAPDCRTTCNNGLDYDISYTESTKSSFDFITCLGGCHFTSSSL